MQHGTQLAIRLATHSQVRRPAPQLPCNTQPDANGAKPTPNSKELEVRDGARFVAFGIEAGGRFSTEAASFLALGTAPHSWRRGTDIYERFVVASSDLKKASDRMEHNAFFDALAKQGVESSYIQLLKAL